MKLPIPIFCKEKVYTEVEVRRPSPGTLADTKKTYDDGSAYGAMLQFIRGVVTSLSDGNGTKIEEKQNISRIVEGMSYTTVEYVCIQSMLKLDSDDGVEGYYTCPRCGTKKICEKKSDKVDTRDFIRDLGINIMEDPEETFGIKLSEPLEIINRVDNLAIETVETIEIAYPTISDCMVAEARIGLKDQARLQYQVFVEALRTVNGNAVDRKWKNRYGMYLFENLPNVKQDMNAIINSTEKYGMEKEVSKTCGECGKVWQQAVNTSNFFVSALA